ncbi:MAG: adaptor protein MecA, partial [Roseburia sp.]|nr:adaptor protein MecA [Roseburia sp.]
TEEEIRDMGFEIDDIIADGDTIQKFMKVVLRRVEQEENISLENVSPIVRAELLPDHSMAITFGGDSEMSFKDIIDTVNRMMNHLDLEKLKDYGNLAPEEKQAMIKDFVDSIGAPEQVHEKNSPKDGASEKSSNKVPKKGKAKEAMICALRFLSMDAIAEMSRGCFTGSMPKSSLYKLEDAYYLVLDFTGIPREEMRAFAFGALEYDQGHYSDERQIAYIKEHGKCIMKKDALEMLMQL